MIGNETRKAGGRLARKPGETSRRLSEDGYARLKQDAASGQDGAVIDRVRSLQKNAAGTFFKYALVKGNETE